MSSTITALTSGGGLAMAGDTSGQLELKTNNGTTAVTIDTSQNVGIGTTTPQNRLELKSTTGTVVARLSCGSGSGREYGIASNTTGEFGIYDYTGSSYRIVIDSAGALIVGDTSLGRITGYRMTINHTDNNGLALKYNGTSEANSISLQNGNGQVGRIYTSGSNTTYATSSDYRLKEDIAPMTGALAKVQILNPVTYKWKSDGSDGQGFIAHELAEVVPDCVGGEKDAVDADGNPVYQDIDTSFLVATLTAAIQELNAKVDAQALEIQALKGVA